MVVIGSSSSGSISTNPKSGASRTAQPGRSSASTPGDAFRARAHERSRCAGYPLRVDVAAPRAQLAVYFFVHVSVSLSQSHRSLLRRACVQEPGRHRSTRVRRCGWLADAPRIVVRRGVAFPCRNANLRGQNHARSHHRRRCAGRAGAPRRGSRAKVAATSLRTPPATDLPPRFVAARRRRQVKRDRRRAAAERLSERRTLDFLPGHGLLWVPWSRIPDAPDSAHEVPRHGWRRRTRISRLSPQRSPPR